MRFIAQFYNASGQSAIKAQVGFIPVRADDASDFRRAEILAIKSRHAPSPKNPYENLDWPLQNGQNIP
jgi:hypothetical protein